ncbi:hypothetical protein Har1130_18775 [Haloarcula sp. CBA1130]|nr:hypothetical protein Har1130_18775 [Haloarcula sp. CBA1130]
MRRFTRYIIALVIAGGITAGVATRYHSVILLLGIFQIYTVSIAIILRYPALVWDSENGNRWASGVFSGGLTFGVLSLAQGLNVEFHFGAGVLGFGLAVFGLACGVWMAD